MSTKNLARTVIEGGRTGWSRWFRHETNAALRAQERVALRRSADGLVDLDGLVIPRRKKVERSFADKLAPPRRWLERQVGRPWDLVRGELLERFDPRTTAGRHIIFDHVLPSVESARRCFAGGEFTVDRHGILRRTARRPRPALRFPEPLPCDADAIAAWLAGRRVGTRGDLLFWFTPTGAGAYRQHRRLDEDEVMFWRRLPAWVRDRCDPSASSPDSSKGS